MAVKDFFGKMLNVDKLLDKFGQYAETRLELVKLELKRELAVALSKVLVMLAIGILGLLTLVFFLTALAWVLNAALESYFWGHVIVFGLCLLTFVIFLIARKSHWFKSWIGGLIKDMLGVDPYYEEEKEEAIVEEEEIKDMVSSNGDSKT